MATVIINEKTKEGKAMLEFLRKTEYATVIEKSVSVDSVAKGLAELDDLKWKRRRRRSR